MSLPNEPGSQQVGFVTRFVGLGLAVAVIASITLGVVAVCDALASSQPADKDAVVAVSASYAAMPSNSAAAMAYEAREAALVVQLAAYTVADHDDSNADEPAESVGAEPSEVARISERVENGVLVVRHGPTEVLEITRDL